MRSMILFMILPFGASALAQQPLAAPNPSTDIVYVCPDDESVRSNVPGICPSTRTPMVAAIPDPAEYGLDLRVTPQPPMPGQVAHLTLQVLDPWKRNPVTRFAVMHEKLLHAFLVSEDLDVFMHEHPVLQDGNFRPI